ncbi:uncharacterized protein LOC117291590 [Asterias rubens]|uniref:uncharacterized protein LOC117291590 n=1 Tax=Asterias rubens TaxID=7604 RepID=UPI001455A244|nr:uncharacterized protein LOC117291590 [Asterias rubens]XP_033629297.1 uncharacterized protein LOC117291590 [Asterias rubens]
MGNRCCNSTSDEEGDIEQQANHEQQRGPIKSEQARSNYLREKLKDREGERKPLLSTTNKRVIQPNRVDGIVDPRQAAHLRGEKLREAEQATEDMNKAAGNWAKAAAMLKTL